VTLTEAERFFLMISRFGSKAQASAQISVNLASFVMASEPLAIKNSSESAVLLEFLSI
jgi:hypothetical protein